MLAFVAPHDCLGCGIEGALLCSVCLAGLPLAGLQKLAGSDLTKVYSVTSYTGVAKDLLWRLKSYGAQEAALIMAEAMSKYLPEGRCYVVPIPTASSRVRQRGYNQAKLLTRELSKFGNSAVLDCLVRHGQAHQVGAGREQRVHQLSGAFRLKSPLLIRNAHIILVDDVVTTGATLEVVAELLKHAGAARVDAITFAQAQLRIKPEFLRV